MTKTNRFDQADVLITGGSAGIGRGLAERFLLSGSRVLVTGRKPEELAMVASQLPGLKTFVSDIGRPEDRELLATHVAAEMPALSVLINNAGFQRRVALAADDAPWSERQAEIDALFAGPVHLNSLLVPLMLRRGGPGILVNVTSGGAFVPQVFAPIYSASKAALHSYTVSLRQALAQTQLHVVELAPPAVQTGLAGPGANHGAPLNEFCDAAFSALQQDEADLIGFGQTASPEFKKLAEAAVPFFTMSAARFPVATYAEAPQSMRTDIHDRSK